jgi:hypothetical protein
MGCRLTVCGIAWAGCEGLVRHLIDDWERGAVVGIVVNRNVQIVNFRVSHLHLIWNLLHGAKGRSHIGAKAIRVVDSSAILGLHFETALWKVWWEELEVFEEVLVKDVLRHLLHELCVLLHQLLLIFDLELLKLILMFQGELKRETLVIWLRIYCVLFHIWRGQNSGRLLYSWSPSQRYLTSFLRCLSWDRFKSTSQAVNRLLLISSITSTKRACLML